MLFRAIVNDDGIGSTEPRIRGLKEFIQRFEEQVLARSLHFQVAQFIPGSPILDDIALLLPQNMQWGLKTPKQVLAYRLSRGQSHGTPYRDICYKT